MAVKRRLSMYSGMRIDVPHIRSVESATSFDFDSTLRGLVTGLNKPYLIRGFKMNIPANATAPSNLSIKVADSALLHSSASESGTILSVDATAADEVLNSANPRVVGAFQNGVPNYVCLDYTRVVDTTTIDQTAGWSASQKLEFQRTVPIGRILDYRIIITTTGFGSYLPLYIVGVDNLGNVQYITKSVDGLFRLGRGGSVPDPQYKFDYQGLENTAENAGRREWINTRPDLTPNPMSVVPGDPAQAFDYGDWAITSLKEWMDAVMTRFRELTGSSYWYTDSSLLIKPPNTFDTWFDAVGSTLTGTGSIAYNLILEAVLPSLGAFQSAFTDSTALAGDSYVIGATSGARGNISIFNNAQLIVNSLSSQGFIPLETLYNRRVVRFNAALFELTAYDDGVNTYAKLQRIPAGTGSYTTVTAWSYDNDLVTITAAGHGLSVGAIVEVKGLATSGANPPNGVWEVKHVGSSSTFQFTAVEPITGTASVSAAGVRLDNPTKLPYLPSFQVSSWSYSGANISLQATNHNIPAPVSLNGDTHTTDIVDGISSTSSLSPGLNVAGAGIDTNTQIKAILSSTSVQLSKPALATASGVSITYAPIIIAANLIATTNAPNGRYVVSAVLPNGTIQYTAGATPTGTAGVGATSNITPDYYSFALTIDGADPTTYDATDVNAITRSTTALRYIIGPASMPSQPAATGPIKFDGVVAYSLVADPVRVRSAANGSGGTVVIKTFTPHGLSSGGPLTRTIYGDPTLSPFITTYTGVNIALVAETISSISRSAGTLVTVVTSTNHGLTTGESVKIASVSPGDFNGTFVITFVSANSFTYNTVDSGVLVGSGGTVTNLNQFVISGAGLPTAGAYTNGGTDNVFVNSPNNPYPGPIQWSSDLILKAIIGDKYFKIPLTATADGTATANKFNVNGVTGTAYLQDGEVAYIILERNKSVSAGSLFSTTGGGNPMVGSTPPVDEAGNPLVVGDFVKFDDEDETKWLRITNISGNQIFLITDRGLTPNISQRPAKTGRLSYSKGTYSVVHVQPHWMVDSSADVYWIAVRRDNGGSVSKVYLKGLELEQGEVRQINDNTSTNLLQYTGAGSESAINPNYTIIDSSGNWQYTQSLSIASTVAGPTNIIVDVNTRMVTFASGPALGFQKGDKLVKSAVTYTVNQVFSDRTVQFIEDVSGLAPADAMLYYRLNYSINDSDNLTLAIRKEDRELAKLNTELTRIVYDENAYIQQMNFTGSGTIRSGSYIYLGSASNPSGLAWVMHGNVAVNEVIEGNTVSMPGGHASLPSNAILVSIISGSFPNGSTVFQNGVTTSLSVNNPGNPPFDAPAIAGGTPGTGVELVMMPNRRTQIVGSGYVVWPSFAKYKASLDPVFAGEDLAVSVNDGNRTAVVDYEETFGGPKGKIRLVRDLPPNTRLRLRLLSSIGSALASKQSSVDLQGAYNAGSTVQETSGRPINLIAGNPSTGEATLRSTGSIEVDGRSGPNVVGGIFGPQTPSDADQAFVIGKESNKPKEAWTALQAVKTHQSHPGSSWQQKTCGDTTTNNTARVLTGSEVLINPDTVMRVRATVVMRDQSNGGSAAFMIEGLFKRGTALSSAVAVGSPTTTIIGQDGNGIGTAVVFGLADLDFNTFFESIVVVVYGANAATQYWVASIDYQAVSLPS